MKLTLYVLELFTPWYNETITVLYPPQDLPDTSSKILKFSIHFVRGVICGSVKSILLKVLICVVCDSRHTLKYSSCIKSAIRSAVEWSGFLLFILEITASDLFPESGNLSQVFRGFSLFLNANSRMLPHTTPEQFLSYSYQINYCPLILSFHGIFSESVNKSLSKPRISV